MRLQPLLAAGGFLVAMCAVVMAISQLTGFGDFPVATSDPLAEWVDSFRRRSYELNGGTVDSVHRVYDIRAAHVRVLQVTSWLQNAEAQRWKQNPTDVARMEWARPLLWALLNGPPERNEAPPGCEDSFQDSGFRPFSFARPFLKRVSDKPDGPAMTAFGPPGAPATNLTTPTGVMEGEPPSVPDVAKVRSLSELPAGYTFLYCHTTSEFRAQFTGVDGATYVLSVEYIAAPPDYSSIARPITPDYGRTLLYSAMLALLGMVFLSLLLTRSIFVSARAVHRARDHGGRVSDLPGGFITEVQEIAEGVNGMVVSLSSTVERISNMQEFARSLADGLRHYSSHLSEHARRQRGAGDAAREAHERLRRGISGLTQLAGAVGREARAVLGESKMLMEKFAGSAQRVQSLNGAHSTMIGVVRKLYKLNQSALTDVGEGTRALERSLTAFKALNGSVDAIGDRVDKISEIAEQTNLLALNAAIQAASGGEKGKSFALVAEEVRKLADLSADTTKEIVLQVQSTLERLSDGQQTLSEVFAVFGRLSEGATELDRQLVAMATALDALGKDLVVITEICQRVTEVAPVLVRASEAQQKAVNELSAHSDGLASADSELTNFVSTLTEMAERTSKEAFELDRITRDLMGHAESLKSAVSDLQE